MPVLNDLREFNAEEAQVSLWVFKGPTGAAGEQPRYSARWVETTDDVDAILKETVVAERARIEEAIDYGLLVQNNEASAMQISKDETHADLLVEAVAAEVAQRRASAERHLMNTRFYLIKLVHEQQVLHAVRRTSCAWKTKRTRSMRSFVYDEHRLAVDDRPHFEIEKSIDYFVFGDELLILNKGSFESTLRYKAAHIEDFSALQLEQDFSSAFTDLAPLVAHVGDNKIQLRRVSAIRQKGHYRDADFMDRLRRLGPGLGFTIQFGDDGKIVATAETCAEIITALLDHRLSSAFSIRTYDVPSATQVRV